MGADSGVAMIGEFTLSILSYYTRHGKWLCYFTRKQYLHSPAARENTKQLVKYLALFHSYSCNKSYMYVSLYDCLWKTHTKYVYQNAWVELRGPNTCMLKVRLGSLKQSSNYNFRLEFLILPSSGRLKTTCDTHIIHFY